MSDPIARLAPRSAGAIADTELLRVARTDTLPPIAVDGPSLADRLRSLLQRIARTDGASD